MSNATKFHYAPFTWVKQEQSERYPEEVWAVELPEGLGMTRFVLKNYGGKPVNDERVSMQAFTGWRLVSGGPFARVGGWNSFKEALPAVTLWLIKYYREQAADKIADANKIIQHVSNFQDQIIDVIPLVVAGEQGRSGK